MLRLVRWSEFARQGKRYRRAIENGDRFVILADSRPIALIVPIELDDVEIVVDEDRLVGRILERKDPDRDHN